MNVYAIYLKVRAMQQEGMSTAKITVRVDDLGADYGLTPIVQAETASASAGSLGRPARSSGLMGAIGAVLMPPSRPPAIMPALRPVDAQPTRERSALCQIHPGVHQYFRAECPPSRFERRSVGIERARPRDRLHVGIQHGGSQRCRIGIVFGHVLGLAHRRPCMSAEGELFLANAGEHTDAMRGRIVGRRGNRSGDGRKVILRPQQMPDERPSRSAPCGTPGHSAGTTRDCARPCDRPTQRSDVSPDRRYRGGKVAESAVRSPIRPDGIVLPTSSRPA
jgi:hypothetical protein